MTESRAAFLKISPTGKMPALRDDARDRTVLESTIVVEYLAAHYPGPVELVPADIDLALAVRQADRFYDFYVQEPMQKIVGDRLRPQDKTDPFGVEQARAQLRNSYAIIEQDMQTKIWAMGDAFSHGRLRGVSRTLLRQQGRAVRRQVSCRKTLSRPPGAAARLRPGDRGSAALLQILPLQQRLIAMLHDPAQLDLMFQALADPARRQMVDRLSRGPASVSQLAEPLAMSLSAVVQHLNLLEASGLVRTQKLGRVRTCQIEPKALRAAEHWINERRLSWERRLDRLGDFLAETKDES